MSTTSKPPKTPANKLSPAKTERDERLQLALRDNLKKRRIQTQTRKAEPVTPKKPD